MKKSIAFPVMILAVTIFGVASYSQNAKAPAATSHQTAAAPPASTPPSPAKTATEDIALTEAEKAAIDLNQEKVQNLDLKSQLIERQIQDARKQLSDETAALSAKFAKAHGIDLEHYQLVPGQDVFRPVAAKSK